ncbi:hypothetical protein GJV85_06415 [Sulfurimonas aquatica]|uniref:3'-5' exonuclease n=1 Tax=Sulfurimonas aquatica TaxID=2672570 RepID=A0A975B033_9BACT|nr:3'-5' exonuclease [Sulfurimonas aquatica]QSZ41756.1 hypothetical protein GJV85_06415 [Sulfurimonas aquatica]
MRDFAGEEALQQLDKALLEALPSASESLSQLTEFFALLDSPRPDITTTMPAYSTQGREISVIQNKEELDLAIESLKYTRLIGFDSEQKPTFKKGETPNGVAVIQLATPNLCYVIQIKKIKDISSLIALIENDNIVKVGINLVGDREALYSEFGIKMRGTIDIDRVLSKLTSRNSIGAKKAARIFLNQNLQKSKSMSTSNWETPTLSQSQIKYAAEDACIVYDVTVHLLKTYPFVMQAMPLWFQENFKDEKYSTVLSLKE